MTLTLWEALSWSVLRAAVVGTVAAWCVGRLTRRGDKNNSGSPAKSKYLGDRALLVTLIVPAMLPGLLVGYAYRPEGLRWVITPWKADLLHGVIAIGRTLPWAALIAFVVGSGGAGRDRLAWEQTRAVRPSISHRIGQVQLWVNDRAGTIAAGLVAGLLTFGEAEIAALLQARGWPEWTFQKLRGGWPVDEIAVRLWPVVFAAIVVLLSSWWLLRRKAASDGQGSAGASGVAVSTLVWLLVVAVFVIGFGIPVWRLGGDALRGATAITRQTAFWGEVVRTVFAAGIASGIAWLAASRLVAGRTRSRDAANTQPLARSGEQLRQIALAFVVTFGVTGSLLVSVAMQSLPGRLLWETVIPQYAALVTVLLPIATLVAAATRRFGTSRTALVAEQLAEHANRDVRRGALRHIWRRRTAPRIGALGLLYWLAFWDLQTAALLAPPGWATAPGRLYNLAHYGQSEALAAMLMVLSVIAFAIPAFALLVSYRWTVR